MDFDRPLMAQNCRLRACPLLGVERKLDFETLRAVDDPKRTRHPGIEILRWLLRVAH